MKKLLYLIIPIVLIGCDDGDIITNDFDFDDSAVEACDPTDGAGATSNYVFYQNEDSNFESLVLQFNTDDDILNTVGRYGPYSISSTSFNSFEYRKFDASPGDDYYCNSIPPSSPRVIEVFTAIGGEINVTTSIRTLDDNDGIPADQEGAIFVDGVIDHSAINHQDTDGDGIPDYLDIDDDGDNVLTTLEGVELDSDGNINLMESDDTDGDGILDYLDEDDDDDGILTRNESIDGDIDPINDFALNAIVPNFRNPMIANEANPLIMEYIPHTIERTIELSITLQLLNLQNESQEIVFDTVYDFGDFIKDVELLTCTPAFNPPPGSDGCEFQ
ncbi:hypothetical protein LX97_00185 [Nonlabens dokdonensis]|nr:hypothetical protein [Nonlabens dokdonensis]PZX43185.1 hypothetical protein LX97_00185 [Nonlabens dokdonensis]